MSGEKKAPVLTLPLQAILTANAMRHMAASPGLDPDLAAAMNSHADDLMNAALEHIRAVEAEAVALGSSTRLELARRGIAMNIPEVAAV